MLVASYRKSTFLFFVFLLKIAFHAFFSCVFNKYKHIYNTAAPLAFARQPCLFAVVAVDNFQLFAKCCFLLLLGWLVAKNVDDEVLNAKIEINMDFDM